MHNMQLFRSLNHTNEHFLKLDLHESGKRREEKKMRKKLKKKYVYRAEFLIEMNHYYLNMKLLQFNNATAG